MFARREVRLNLEDIYDRRSVVGYFAIPQALGATGSIFNGNVEVFFRPEVSSCVSVPRQPG